MSIQRCIIVHGCFPDAEKVMDLEGGLYEKYWASWIKKELLARGIEAATPRMPKPDYPEYESFKAEFEKLRVDENTVLVGHSCGCGFLARWLGETKTKIAKLIFVAPWNVSKEEDEARRKFYDYSIDATIPERVGEIVMFTADNESRPGKKSLQILHDALGGEIIDLPGRCHYLIDDMGTAEFPELLEVISR
ncbi:MAG: alpha/beta hydrolase [Candidatus Moranbacteria bacterium]|nr:alpha/beta hydrolase [Candidatus Moranbacteria bacterium]